MNLLKGLDVPLTKVFLTADVDRGQQVRAAATILRYCPGDAREIVEMVFAPPRDRLG